MLTTQILKVFGTWDPYRSDILNDLMILLNQSISTSETTSCLEHVRKEMEPRPDCLSRLVVLHFIFHFSVFPISMIKLALVSHVAV